MKKTEDQLCGEIIQQFDIEVLLQDADAFENVFFPSTHMDYNLTNLNEIIDFDELQSILDEEKDQGMHSVIGKEGCGSSGSHDCTTVVAAAHGEPMHVKRKPKNEQQAIKKWTTRKRIQKGTPEAYEKKELHKIKNREADARAFAQKKAYVVWLELEVQKYRKKNTDLKRLLLFAESSTGLDMPPKQLRRINSGLL